MANGRCRQHGGKTPRGIAHHSLRNGKYSRDLPLRLAARYKEALESSDLLSLRDDIAVCETRIGELLQRVDSGESGAAWRKVKDLHREYKRAMQARDVAAMQDWLTQLSEAIDESRADYPAWAELQKTWETRRRLIETEQKALLMHQQMLTVEQMMIAIGLIEQVIYRRVTQHANKDTATAILTTISADIRQEAFLGIVR